MTIQTLGDRIKFLRGEESRPIFAAHFNTSVATIARYEGGDTAPDAEFIKQICDKYSVNSDWLLWGEDRLGVRPATATATYDDSFIVVPKVAAELSAGGGSFLDSVEILEYLSFKKDWAAGKGKLKDLALMSVRGDSMEPIFHDHDLALINLSKTTPYSGGIFAVGFDGVIFLKRLFQEPGKIILRSENDEYADVTINLNDEASVDSVQIIGRAVWWCHDEIVK